MKKKRPEKQRRPTEAELDFLHVLWDHGPCTVREMLGHLSEPRGYTTVLKHLQIMYEKGLVGREAAGQSHRYRAAVSEQDTQRGMVRHLVDRVFRKSPHALVMHALDEHGATPEELAEIRELIDMLEKARKDGD